MSPEDKVVKAVVDYFKSDPRFADFRIVKECEIQMGSDYREADIAILDASGNFIVIAECKSQGGANYGIPQLKSYLSATNAAFGLFAPRESPDAWVFYQNLGRNSFHQIDTRSEFEKAVLEERDICERFVQRISALKNEKAALEEEISQKKQQSAQTDGLADFDPSGYFRRRMAAKMFNSEFECSVNVERLKALQQQRPFLPEVIPPALANSSQWIVWSYEVSARKNGKFSATKVPYQAKDPGREPSLTCTSDWSDLTTALLCLSNTPHIDGIGYVFSQDDGLSGVDFDNCRDSWTGGIRKEFQFWIEKLGGYAEVSPSGTGIKVWVKGTVADKYFKTGQSTGFRILNYAGGEIEVYRRGQYFALTTQRLEGFDSLVSNQAVLDVLCEFSRVLTFSRLLTWYPDLEENQLDALEARLETLAMPKR